jgi:hypothetical protein
MQRLLCILLGHRYASVEVILGFGVRRCSRCGHAEPVSG